MFVSLMRVYFDPVNEFIATPKGTPLMNINLQSGKICTVTPITGGVGYLRYKKGR